MLKHAARRRSRRHENQAGTVERRDQSGEGVPCVLANEHRCSSPRSVEGAYAIAAFDKTLLVKEPIGRQEVLAVHVQHDGVDTVIAVQPHIHHAVVQIPGELFVKPNHDIDRLGAGRGGPERLVQSARRFVECERQFAHAALDEISRK